MNIYRLMYLSLIIISSSLCASESGISIKIPNTFSIAPSISRADAVRLMAIFSGCVGTLLLKKSIEQLCSTEGKNNFTPKNIALATAGLAIGTASASAIIYSDRLK